MLEKLPQRWGLCPLTSVGFRRLGTLLTDPQDVTPTQFTCYFKQLIFRHRYNYDEYLSDS